MPVKTALTDLEKQTICAMRTQGVSNQKIADSLGLHPVTVSKTYHSFLRAASPIIDDLGDWRRDMKILAVKAVKRGLTDESDKYKAGNLGVQALRGIGEFEQEGNTLNFQALINSIPANMRARYISSEDLKIELGTTGDGTQSSDESNDEK